MGYCKHFASLLALVALVSALFKGFLFKKVPQFFAVAEQPTAYGSQEQAGFGIQRTLSLNH